MMRAPGSSLAQRLRACWRPMGLPLLLASSLPLTAGDKWVEVKTPHFTVESNAGADRAKETAKTFEEIRAVFQSMFKGIRVDAGRPMTVLALKDDDTLKTYLLEYAAAKDRAKLGGWFQSTRDMDYAAINVTSFDQSELGLHAIVHEYTHSIIRMNFGSIPTWLNEGFAEYYGNTQIKKDEVDLGMVTGSQIALLQRGPLIPLDVLLKVDHQSPLYSERNRASVFYAQSWVLVHYLLNDPEALQGHFLQKYLAAVARGLDDVAAATEGFGDLPTFEGKLKAYARRQGFRFMRTKPMSQIADKDLALRPISQAEELAVRSEYESRTGHVKEGAQLAAQALSLAPDLPAAHASAGLAAFHQADFGSAEKEFLKSESLGGASPFVPFYLSELAQQKSGSGDAAIGYLESCLARYPEFMPALEHLAFAYLQQPTNREKALAPALKAAQLDPAQLSTLTNLGEVYLALGMQAEARQVGERVRKAAREPWEKEMASRFLSRLEPMLN